ncbi:MAG: hypothetical protein QXE05_06485 [Nitrososphaeria archaeon]
MHKTYSIIIISLLIMVSFAIPLLTFALSPQLTIIEWSIELSNDRMNAIAPDDNSMQNPDYKLLRYRWYITAEYYINPTNFYGFSTEEVVDAITSAADTWDKETSFPVFNYKGTTEKSAGVYDGYNVIAWGSYKSGVIAVTFIWRIGRQIVETDTLLNTYYEWSLSGESGKMDVQNIMTHEFGHWCGLADLYKDKDYWLTMYGYASYGETYKRTLGLGDILGLQKVYGS